MLIAFIFEAFPSPSETFLRREVEALRSLGLDVRAFAWRAGEGALPLPRSPGLGSRLARRARGEAWWRDQGTRWARESKAGEAKAGGLKIDHIHAAWASFPAAWASAAARELKVPWSFSAHARDLWVEGGDLRAKLGSAAFAAACTRSGAERLRSLAARPERVLYAPHGLPLAQWPRREWQPYEPARPFQILSVGRLVPKKGFDVLLRSLQLWLSDHPDRAWQATIIGDGPERARLERLSAALGLEGRVRFAGAQSSEAVRASMLQCDVFVLPCRVARDGDRDGLPNVLLEAGATGVPLIVGDAGSVRDLCDDSAANRNAWLFAPRDVEALQGLLSSAWLGLQEHESPWRAACERARARVEAGFSSERNVHVLADAFARAAASRAAGGEGARFGAK